ncbi:MAG TPA: carboxylesterase [Citreicella sp.]|jgi:hypothetical protein|nr:carboxylesterase [Citreicella sp.]
MGLISTVISMLFGSGRNVLVETAGILRPNAEAQAARAQDLDTAALQQMAAEFAARDRGAFDRLMDGVNRLPRPMMVLGIVWLLVQTARDPARMSQVFQAWAILPEAAWVVFGVVVTFYFGGRAQLKDQEFSAGLLRAAAAARALPPAAVPDPHPMPAPDGAATPSPSANDNAALAEWRISRS